MSACCEPQGYDRVFDARAARVAARRYRRSGLTTLPQRTVDLYRDGAITGATLLEVGSGIGDLAVEMLRAGMASATCVDLSGAYDDEAAALAAEAGLTGRITRATGDLAAHPGLVRIADVVVLHSVVCCYPDARRLVAAAASRARHHLVISFPRDSWLVRAWAPLVNIYPRLRGSDWRFVVHPRETILQAAADAGLAVRRSERLRFDEHVVLTRGVDETDHLLASDANAERPDGAVTRPDATDRRRATTLDP